MKRFFLFSSSRGWFRCRLGGVSHFSTLPDLNDGWDTEAEAERARAALNLSDLTVKPYSV